MSSLVLRSFKFSLEDVRKLDALVLSEQCKMQDGVFPLRINRTALLQHLISVAYIRMIEEEATAAKSLQRTKKRAKKVLNDVQK